MANIIYIGSDNTVTLTGLQNQTDASYCNSATVTMTVYEYTKRKYLDKSTIQDEGSKLGFYCSAHSYAANDYYYLHGTPDYDAEYIVGATSTDDYIVSTGTYSATKNNALDGTETVHKALSNARNLSLAYISSSDGNYRGTIPDTIKLHDQNEYFLVVTATDSASNVLTIRQKYEANYKD